jgi:hypothetical protein
MLEFDVDSFLLACQHVGQTQGILISPGNGSPEGIISSSEARLRPIELQANWWIQHNGPFIGRLSKEGIAVAVLPSLYSGYVMVAGQTRIRVTSAIAQTLDSRAYVLYWCLGDRPLNLTNLVLWGWRRTKQDILFAAICTLISQASALAIPFLLWEMVDSRMIGSAPTFIPTLIIIICTGAFLLLHLAIKTALYRVETLLSVLYQATISDRILRLSGTIFPTSGCKTSEHVRQKQG